ncbi:hypothetical protein [Alteriqipengyuania sp. 357]
MSTLRIATPARVALALSLLAVTCCQTPEPPPPAPAPPPAPVTTAPPPQVTVPPADNWIDRPQTPGDWAYVTEPGETLAVFGRAGAPVLVVGCDLASRRIGITRATAARRQEAAAMRITAETTARQLMAEPVSASPPLVGVTLDARDPLLDAMAITRGRFAVEVEGEPGLYVPAWAEVTRVIEDCR